jgi:tRNA(fMet)-specific endonuclease VapC
VIHLDTSFLVDLMREARRASDGPATAKLAELADETLGASLFVRCELEAGVAASTRPDEERRRIGELFAVLALSLPGPEVAALYGRLLVDLERRGEAIATMDLLIAASALADGAPLVTRNVRHFERIGGLELLGY